MLEMLSRLCFVLPVFCLTVSCKETVRDISHDPEMSERIDAYIAEMAAIEDAFPQQLEPLKAESNLEPLRFWESGECNALLIEKMQLAFVDSDWGFSNDDYFEVGEGYGLARFFSDRHSGDKEAPENYRQLWEDVLGLRYLVIADCYYDKPKIDEDKVNDSKQSWEALRASFTGGKAHATIAIFDRQTDSWLGGFKVEADPPGKVEFEVREEWHFSRDLPYYLRSHTEGRLARSIEEQLKPYLDKSSEDLLEQGGEGTAP